MNVEMIELYWNSQGFWGHSGLVIAAAAILWAVLKLVLVVGGLVWKLACKLFGRLWAEIVKKKDNLNRGEIVLISIFLEALILAPFVASVVLLQSFLSRVGILALGLSVFWLSVFLLVYLWWAPNNLFFTFVPEGRAKIVVRADQFKRAIINWRGHVLVTPKNSSSFPNKDVWDVAESSPKNRLFGGLFFYGLFPLDDIYVYNFSWTNMRQNGDVEYHEPKTIDYILLKEDVYLGVVEKAEDKAALPTDIKLVMTMKVMNPYKALFNVQNWLETIMNRVRASVRNAFTEDTYDRWISEDQDLADRILEKLGDFRTIECEGRYGVEVRKVEVTDINPGESFRQATLKKFLGEKEAERLAVEISNTVINMMASIDGVTVKKMQEKIVGDPKLKLKYQNYCLKRFTDKMAAESGSWVKIDASAGAGIKKDLMEILAGLVRIPQGSKKRVEVSASEGE
jgi:SPFH domain / Band 7 family